MSNPLELFDQATRTVTEERGAVYGHPADDFARIAHMAKAIEGCPDAAVKHALYLILTKISRLVTSPDHLDSVVDIAGYARCIAMVLERRHVG